MEISKEDFVNWRSQAVTQAFLEVVLEIIDIEANHLAVHAGHNPLDDRYRAGHIRGLAELVDWVPDYIEDDTDADSEGT